MKALVQDGFSILFSVMLGQADTGLCRQFHLATAKLGSHSSPFDDGDLQIMNDISYLHDLWLKNYFDTCRLLASFL